MATPYFSKKLTHLLNETGNILTYQNLNLILSDWNTKFVTNLKSTQHLPLLQFCQKLSYKLLSRTRSSIIKLRANSIGLSRMLWILFCPVITKELFLEIAAPKRQAKSLKLLVTTQLAFFTFASCTTGIYEKQFFNKHFLKRFC